MWYISRSAGDPFMKKAKQLANAVKINEKRTVAVQYMTPFCRESLCIKRPYVVQMFKKLHTDHSDLWKQNLYFEYEEEDGIDTGGITRDVMATLWEKWGKEFVDDLHLTLVPDQCINKSCVCELYSRIFVQSFLLTGQVSYYLYHLFLFGIFCSPSEINPELLNQCVQLFIEHHAVDTQRKLLASCESGVSVENKEEIKEFFEMYEHNIKEHQLNAKDFQSHLKAIVKERLFQNPPHFVKLCREKLAETVGGLTAFNAFEVLNTLQPTGKKIIEHLSHMPLIQLSSPQKNVLDFLRRFLTGKGDDIKLMKLFLKFVTGSSSLTEPVIKVKFQQNSCCFPQTTTCSNLIYLPVTINIYSDFEALMVCVLESDESQLFSVP